jgi:hypothetical protein
MGRRLRLVVLGMMGRMPLAGVAWQVLHYLEGFRRLGADVYYVEDTGSWPYDPKQNTITQDSRYTIEYISQLMAWCGFQDHWAYRAAAQNEGTFGLSESQVQRLFDQADALVNVTGSTVLRAEHLHVPVRIYLETDPVLPQIEVAKGSRVRIDQLDAHTHHLTYGENLGAPDCGVPVGHFEYRPTRQPIVLDWWTPTTGPAAREGLLPSTACFTTVANWRQSCKDFEWRGETYTWSKHHEFLKFIDLPRRTAQPLELALAVKGNRREGEEIWVPADPEDGEALRLLTSHGWRVIDAMALSKNISPYRDYILASRGEFTVAKDQNVRLRSGWFSDRSACYLAAGRPVVTQDTGFGKFLPTGEGLFAFSTIEDAVAAVDAIGADYARHSGAARAIAEEYFRAETVLAKLIQDAGL